MRSRTWRSAGLMAFLGLFSISSSLRGDAPLLPPRLVEVCSVNDDKVCARSDPAKKLTTVFRRTKTGQLKLWTYPGWHRSFFVSEDGESIVIGDDGLGLLPLDHAKNPPLFRFVTHGRLVHVVTLNDLLPDPAKLKRTVSHVSWGHCIGIIQNGQFLVETADNELHAFNVKTGAREEANVRHVELGPGGPWNRALDQKAFQDSRVASR
ncbi:MAG: hypothetical protein ABIT01_14000 [Thermoanaerobaculia bacterium]